MATFFGEQLGTIEFFGEGVEPAQKIPKSMTAQLASLYKFHSGKTEGNLRADIEGGMYPILRADLSNAANGASQAEAQSVIDSVLSNQPDPTKAAEVITQASEGFVFEDHVRPDVALSLPDGEFSRVRS